MADSPVFERAVRNTDRAAAPRADEPAPGPHAGRRRTAGGLDRPSQVPAEPAFPGLQRQQWPGGAPPSRVPALDGSGDPLAASLRGEMEARLGADLSEVRVHTGAAARASAAEFGARAYAVGSHVVIGDGGADKRTLAHELTHVLQQREGAVAGTDYGGGLRVSDPSDRDEMAAEANAARVMSAPPSARPRRAPAAAPVASGSSPVTVQRMISTARSLLGRLGNQPATTEPATQPPATKTPPVVTENELIARSDTKTVPMVRQGSYYVFKTARGGTGYVHRAEVGGGGKLSDLMFTYVFRYVLGELALYRGVPRWQRTWHDVESGVPFSPYGTGPLPDFDTDNTSFIPFTPDVGVARGAAVASKGVGPGDKIEMVQGYTVSDPQFPVGILVTYHVSPKDDIGFLNTSEIQVRGPVSGYEREISRMGTDIGTALGNPPIGTPISQERPNPPTGLEVQAYINLFGGLIK